VSWSGTDSGSGVATYDVYVSDDDGAWELWQNRVTFTAALFTGQVGHRYAFYSIAYDTVGNAQATPSEAQSSTSIVPPDEPTMAIETTLADEGEIRTLTFPMLPGYDYTVEHRNSLDSVEGWQALPDAPHNSGSVTDITTAARRFYRLRRTQQQPSDG
jgi:hypothetical protein